jgi:hypothetical protein
MKGQEKSKKVLGFKKIATFASLFGEVDEWLKSTVC